MRVFSNGGRYEGGFIDGELGGEGVMVFPNGTEYVGEWCQGKFHGQGSLRDVSGDRYDGQFFFGVPYGLGIHCYADGGMYEGEFISNSHADEEEEKKGGFIEEEDAFPKPTGKREGFGVRKFVSGNEYSGAWKNDEMTGKGTLTKREGGKYEGDFINGVREGEGSETWGNELGIQYECPVGRKHPGRGFCSYEGDYHINDFHGKGKFVCQDGRWYEGDWENGMRHGVGTQLYALPRDMGDEQQFHIGKGGSLYSSWKYEGEWCDNKREGAGVLFYVNQDVVIGNFVRGHPEGECIILIRGITERLAWYECGQRACWLEDDYKEYEEDEILYNEFGEVVERERNQPDIIAKEYLKRFLLRRK